MPNIKIARSQDVIDLSETCPYCLKQTVQEIGHYEKEDDEQYFVFEYWECRKCKRTWDGESYSDCVSPDPCPKCGSHWGRDWWYDRDLHPENYDDDGFDGMDDFVATHCNDCGHTWPF